MIRYIIRLRILIIFLVIPVFLVFSVLVFSQLLSYDKKVSANALVVEGWMPDYGLQTAWQEYQKGDYDFIFVTGGKFQDFITMYINSFLIFYPQESFYGNDNSTVQRLSIQAGSSLGRNDSAHFVLWVNDKAIADFYTTQNDSPFIVEWEGSVSGIDSLMIQYDNDRVDEKGDRNLRIEYFTLNGQELNSETATLILDRGRPFGKYRWNVTATSYAELAAHFFVNRGVDPEKIIPVTNYYINSRRTYGNALALKDWFDEYHPEVRGINVVSMDYHSRRTWHTYNELLYGNGPVGIISSPNLQLQHSARKKYDYILREAIAYIYYLVFILPWI